jgi:type 1 glutamine amidotransferase
MSRHEKLMRCMVLGAALLALATAASAAPIRVGILAFASVGRFEVYHTSTPTAANAIVSILTNPESENLGPNLVVPLSGILTSRLGPSGQATATTSDVEAIIGALDTTDVLVFVNIMEIGQIFSQPAHREKLLAFSRTKGIVSHHQTLDTYGRWPEWDTLQGARFQNHPSSDREATIRLDTAAKKDAHWPLLNRGLPDTARFLEEWHSFTAAHWMVRSDSSFKVTVNVDETSYAGGMAGARAMGTDHPLSWYRTFPEGGRFFYTALGHRAATFLNTGGNPSTPFVRRQLYNAILWAGGYDIATAIGPHAESRSFTSTARLSLSGSTLAVSILKNEPHTIQLAGLQGKVVDTRRGAGGEHVFQNLRSGVHVVSITTPAGRSARRVAIP